jgi:hypothetical protein
LHPVNFHIDDTNVKVVAKSDRFHRSRVKVIMTNGEDDAKDLLVDNEHVDEALDSVND